MCGLAGFWQFHATPDFDVASRMAGQLRHRGPDASGVWLDSESGLAMAHQRLAVIELSAAGKQPMISSCGRFVLTFNGEIYNHKDLRRSLEHEFGTLDWRGHSDTETLFSAICRWGIRATLDRLNGMFAFAIWDRTERTLYLARDRMGIKPLYYGSLGGVLIFGSELKALRVHPAWAGEIDRDALSAYFRKGYVPSPLSIYRGVYKLPPAHYLKISSPDVTTYTPQCYWNLSEIAERGELSTKTDPNALSDELDILLRDAVGLRMEADVPLGAFLSGGCDSTTVVALMQSLSRKPVKTFTIGFHHDQFDEAKYANAIAKHLGTEHTELYLTPGEAMSVIPDLPQIWDEPFADSSQIPTYLVSRLARQRVTVSLSGDGGDELFCGYTRYALGQRIWSRRKMIPPPVRNPLARSLEFVLPGVRSLVTLLPRRRDLMSLNERIPKLARVLNAGTPEAFYSQMTAQWSSPEDILVHQQSSTARVTPASWNSSLHDLRSQMMYSDMKSYLPDDILTKVDRASMAVSLEARVPLLDHRMVEFAWKVPLTFKVRDGQMKWLLKQVLYKYVPRGLMNRPKHGFGIPLEDWLRGPLRDWAESLLNEHRLIDEGFLSPAPIRQLWQDHLSGRPWLQARLWSVLMFQAWLESQHSAR